jgi:hypothetical protein
MIVRRVDHLCPFFLHANIYYTYAQGHGVFRGRFVTVRLITSTMACFLVPRRKVRIEPRALAKRSRPALVL